MARPLLTQADFERAAKRLQCDVAAVKAVAEVESRGQGFYADGFPVILFERHIFRKYTQGRYNRTHPHLSGPAGNYGPAGQNQRNKFNEAFALNPDAAMKACSWGKFQIMGFNYEICGFVSVGAFVDAMKESEGRQLDAFVSFVIGNHLAQYLRSQDWAAFASRYNGEGYRKNRYDSKMAAAYRKHLKGSAAVKLMSDEPETLPEGSTSSGQAIPSGPQSDAPPTEATQVTETSKREQDVNETVKQPGPEPYQGIGFWGVIKRDLSFATGGNLSFAGFNEYATQASGWPPWVIGIISKVAIGILIATIAYFVFRVVHYAIDSWKKSHKASTEAMINTDITRKNIEFTEPK